MLRPSGVLILTLPFLIRIHNYPRRLHTLDAAWARVPPRRMRVLQRRDRCVGKPELHSRQLRPLGSLRAMAAFAQERAELPGRRLGVRPSLKPGAASTRLQAWAAILPAGVFGVRRLRNRTLGRLAHRSESHRWQGSAGYVRQDLREGAACRRLAALRCPEVWDR
jgi:hypothetical protein